MTEDRETDCSIRNSLLAHYTEEQSAHARDALAWAVIGLTLTQLRLNRPWFVVGLSILAALVIRAYCTSYYWSLMTDEIKRVPRSSEMNQLHNAAEQNVQEHDHGFWAQFSSIRKPCGWALIVVAIIIMYAVLYLGYGQIFDQ